MRIRIILTFLLFIVSAHILVAQNNLMQDDDGKSTFPIGETGSNQLGVNVQDAKVQFTLNLRDSVSAEKPSWLTIGFSLKGKDKEFSITKKGAGNFQGSSSITYARGIGSEDMLKFQTIFYASLEASLSRFKIADTTALVLDDAVTADFAGSSNIQIGLLNKSLFGTRWIAGLAGRAGWNDNVSDLTKHQVFGGSSIGNYTIALDPTEIYIKDEVNKMQFQTISMVDVGRYWNRFSVVSHFRWKTYEGKYPQFKPGLAIYITEKGAPLNSVFGFQYFVDDFFDTKNKGTEWWERSALNIVFGFKLTK